MATETLICTKSAEYLANLGNNSLFRMVERNDVGALVIGNGAFSLQADQQYQGASPFVYFYNTTSPNGLNASGLPDFLNNDLSINAANLVAYTGKDLNPDATDVKKGVVNSRTGVAAALGSSAGETLFWDQNRGTGLINAVAISTVDLLTLRTMNKNAKVFFGKALGDLSYLSSGYIGPNVAGITDANTILMNNQGTLSTYNMSTGDYKPYTGALTAAKICGFWAHQQFVIGGKLYFIGCNNGDYKVAMMDLTTFAITWASAYLSTVQPSFTSYQLLMIGADLYFCDYGLDTITLTKLDLATGDKTATTQVVTVPADWKNSYGVITSFDATSYLMTFGVSGISYKFTDLANPQASCTGVYFTGGSAVTPLLISGAVYFLSQPMYESTSALPGFNNTYFMKNSAIIDGACTPVLAYKKFPTSYDKTATSQLTSSPFFTITAQ